VAVDGLVVRPVVTVAAERRTASSSCHGAKLNLGEAPGTFACRQCGAPCDRVMSGPEEVTLHG
jgi:Zn finger protein HypA/HybF involved in hydrogenase expression